MRSLVSSLSAVVVLGCARPSLPEDLPTSRCAATAELDAGQLLLASADAGEAPSVLGPSNCRAGTYKGRFSCGNDPSTLSGEIALTLAARGAPALLHSATPSALRSDEQRGSGRLAALLEGVVDCNEGEVDMLVQGTYTVACAALPLDGYLEGSYDATRGLLLGRIELLPNIDGLSLPVALNCICCASLSGGCAFAD